MDGQQIKIRTASQLEAAANNLTDSILQAYSMSCPLKSATSNRDVPWWSRKLEKLRKSTRQLFNTAKQTSDWSSYKRALTEYNKEIRKAKRRTWINTCESIENTNVVARLQKALSKDHSNGLGLLKKDDGTFTKNPLETLDLMMRTHFPGSTTVSQMVSPDQTRSHTQSERALDSPHRSRQHATQMARKIFKRDRIENAVRSFQPFKSAGVDGILPVLLQKGEEALTPTLAEICKASLILNHIPSSWRKVRVVFIPKSGKRDKTQPNAFRPISLTSIMLKTMEKVIHEFISSSYMKTHPLSNHQYAYKAGTSTVTALHTLTTKLEKTLAAKEIALCAFLDIEGAFDNANFGSMTRAMRKRNFDCSIVDWIQAMLANREIISELGNSSTIVKATKGCPQGGVLSPLLWSLVADDLLDTLEKHGFEIVGFADDLVIIVRGKFDNVISERMQLALNLSHSWCLTEGLNINPSKTTLISFTNRKKVQLTLPLLANVPIKLSDQVKYLGVILDEKLTWNAHIDAIISKATNALWACSKTMGRKWGLKPKMIMWIYTTIVRPRITYASLVWWPKTKENQTRQKLDKLQRMACLATTGAMRSTPSKALEALLNLTPLHQFVQLEAGKSALRLKNYKNIMAGDMIGHLRILREFSREPVMNMPGDWMQPMDNLDIPYTVRNIPRTTWETGGPEVRPGSLIFFTDGSKMGTSTGAGIFGPNAKISISMGDWPTVFQAEVFAIIECAKLCLKRKYRYANICIFSDSQAALNSLKSWKCSSKLVWECIQSLRLLSQANSVHLYWIPGHSGHTGNENADELARKGSDAEFTGPAPFCGLSRCVIKQQLKKWEENQIRTSWNTTTGLRQSKRFITPNSKIATKLLELSKKSLNTYTGLVTGHCPSRYHLKKMGKLQDDSCRFCQTEPETSEHLICNCPFLFRSRSRLLGNVILTPKEVWTANPVDVVALINHIIPDWDLRNALHDTHLVTSHSN